MVRIGPSGARKAREQMSEAQMQKLAGTNPQLYQDATTGRLPEANTDFMEVANAYPLDE